MDPYLEPHWLDVHGSLIMGAKDVLNEVLPDDLAATSEERVAVESEEGEFPDKRFYPDVRLVELSQGAVAVAEPTGTSQFTAPVRLLAQVERATERSLHIVEAGTERLITVIEFLSPSNKRNPGMSEFRAKRSELLITGVNFIEIDLVRQGNWQSLLRPHIWPPEYHTTYRVTIRKPDDPAAVGLYPISFRDPLPSIAIALRPKDPRIQLDLQSLVSQVYVKNRYGRRLNYTDPLDPPLSAADQAWVATLIAK
jgi:hypothetical protein